MIKTKKLDLDQKYWNYFMDIIFAMKKPRFIFDINPADEDSSVFPSVHQSIYEGFTPSQVRPLKTKQVHPKFVNAWF